MSGINERKDFLSELQIKLLKVPLESCRNRCYLDVIQKSMSFNLIKH